MSLINRMLQDLEARLPEGSADQPAVAQVRAVPPRKAGRAGWLIGGGLLALIALGAAGWWSLQPVAVKARAVPPVPVVAAVPAPGQQAPAVPSPPTRLIGSPATAGDGTTGASRSAFALKLDSALSRVPLPAPQSAIVLPEAAKPAAPVPAPAPRETAASPVAPAASAGRPAPVKPAAAPRESVAAPARDAQAQPERAASEPAPAATISKQVKELTPLQRAENEYRKAAALVQQGRSAEAIDALEQAVQLDPAHKPARQTLAGLLLQQKRHDDAIRVLRDGLRLDPNQPALAMTLARLLADRGDTQGGIEALRAAQAAGAERADFLAFLAALMQRQANHLQAIEYYQAALRKAPQNGVWWMGLGISLQAGNRMAEAQDAYTRAKASSGLTPELLAFVEQRLKQVQR